MKKLRFSMALHFHQPVGNFREVLERSYHNCYRPFLEHLSRYPGIKAGVHISGSLLDYFKEAHPEILALLRDLAARGQAEIIGGPYYEPIMTAIPERDNIAQIRLLAEALKGEFDSLPGGVWVPERVWRPDLAGAVYRAGGRYVILDDTHFLLSGLNKEETYGYFLTGPEGERIAAFSSDKTLRYAIPFKEASDTIEYMRGLNNKHESPLLVYADDVEKFGEWPGTHEWVYTKGWLGGFFEALASNSDWIETVLLSDFIQAHPPERALRIEEGSYEEMMEWAGGAWLNFMDKYPEARQMRGRMLCVSDKLDRFRKDHKEAGDEIYWAGRELYKGQCNCAYWHGVFGGIYMYHLRSAVYNHLIASENIMDKVIHAGEPRRVGTVTTDIDRGGLEEALISNDTVSVYMDPRDGASVRELDYRPICLNVVDTMARRKERYHKDPDGADPVLSGKLLHDKVGRCALRNYFIKKGLTREEFAASSFEDAGGFAAGSYGTLVKDGGAVFKRRSAVNGVDIEITKAISVKSGLVESVFNVKKLSDSEIDALFGVDLNFTMPYLNSDRYRYFANARKKGSLDTSASLENIATFAVLDSGKDFEMRLDFSRNADLFWYFPVETVTQAQTSYRLNHQCACLFPIWKPVFDSSGVFTFTIKWSLGRTCR